MFGHCLPLQRRPCVSEWFYGIHIENRQAPAEVLGDGRGPSEDRLHWLRVWFVPKPTTRTGTFGRALNSKFGSGSPAALRLYRPEFCQDGLDSGHRFRPGVPVLNNRCSHKVFLLTTYYSRGECCQASKATAEIEQVLTWKHSGKI